MHWDRRFAIGVSLIWAVLVSGVFYLLAGIERPPSPAAVLGGQLTHGWNRTNRALARPVATVRLDVRLRTGADFAIIRPDPLYIYVRSPRGDPPCEARWFRPWQPALIHRGRFGARRFLADFPPTKCGSSPSSWEASVIEAGPQSGCSRAELGARIAEFQISRADSRRSGPTSNTK